MSSQMSKAAIMACNATLNATDRLLAEILDRNTEWPVINVIELNLEPAITPLLEADKQCAKMATTLCRGLFVSLMDLFETSKNNAYVQIYFSEAGGKKHVDKAIYFPGNESTIDAEFVIDLHKNGWHNIFGAYYVKHWGMLIDLWVALAEHIALVAAAITGQIQVLHQESDEQL